MLSMKSLGVKGTSLVTYHSTELSHQDQQHGLPHGMDTCITVRRITNREARTSQSERIRQKCHRNEKGVILFAVIEEGKELQNYFNSSLTLRTIALLS